MSIRYETLLRAVLTHPVAMALKVPIKNALWRVKGVGIRNPALPSAPKSWLFLCKGNICRSPFAERLAVELLAKASITGVTCVSAGLDVTQGDRPPDAAIEVGAAYGVSLDTHRPTPLSESLIERADVVITMEAPHLAILRKRFPRHARRFVLLPLFADETAAQGAFQRFNIIDPYGKKKQAFEACYARIHGSLTRMLAETFGSREGWPPTGRASIERNL